MQTFERVIFDTYLPAYNELYQLTATMTSQELQPALYFIAQNIKMHCTYAANHAVIEKCNDILNNTSTKQDRRATLDLRLFELLYSLRTELKSFCVMFYPIVGSDTLKLEKHYTWLLK